MPVGSCPTTDRSASTAPTRIKPPIPTVDYMPPNSPPGNRMAFGDSIRAWTGASTIITYLFVKKVDKLVPTVYNEVRVVYVKIALRKWKNVGCGPTREKGKVTGGYYTGKEDRRFRQGAGCDGDPSRRCSGVWTRTKREGDA